MKESNAAKAALEAQRAKAVQEEGMTPETAVDAPSTVELGGEEGDYVEGGGEVEFPPTEAIEAPASKPITEEASEVKAQERSESEKAPKATSEQVAAKEGLTRQISQVFFSMPGANKFYEVMGKVIETYSEGETKEFFDQFNTDLERFMAMLSVAKHAGFQFSELPLTSENIERIAGAVSGSVQEKLDMYRPAGKGAQQAYQAQVLRERSADMVLHFVDPDGGGLDTTAYIPIGGDDEFLALKLDPTVGSEYSFLVQGQNNRLRIDKTARSTQASFPEHEVYIRWENVGKWILLKRLNLMDGYHPEREKLLKESQGNATRIAEEKADITDERVSDSLFQRITAKATESAHEAVAICNAEGIDPNSLKRVMEAHSYVLAEDNSRFVLQPVQRMEHLEKAVPPPQPQPPQQQLQGIDSDVDDLMQYFNN